MSIDAFSRTKRKLSLGRPVTIQVWSDSTGNGSSTPREWPYLFADWLAVEYPASPVRILPYDTANNVYSPIAISAGNGGPAIDIYNFALPGALLQTGLGNLWTRGLRLRQADCTIINLGLNHAAAVRDDPLVLGELAAGIESYRLGHPETPLVVVKQNPFQDNSEMDKAIRAIDRLAQVRDFTICDVHSAFVAAGKPLSLYLAGDNTHPSQAGQWLYLDAMAALWSSTPASEVYPSPSVLAHRLSEESNLIRNGGFRQWAGAVPDHWNAGGAGTLTASKNTSILSDPSRPYSLRLTAAGGYTHLYQDISPEILPSCRGQALTFAAKRHVDQLGGIGQGCIYIQAFSPSGNVAYNSIAYNNQQNGWVWWAISGVVIPSDATLIRVGLYHDTAPVPSTYPVYFDQATLFPGILPRSL